jgi:hypothetical protein
MTTTPSNQPPDDIDPGMARLIKAKQELKQEFDRAMIHLAIWLAVVVVGVVMLVKALS